MQKFLLSTFGLVSVLLIAGAVTLAVMNSYHEVEVEGNALGAATQTAQESPTPAPTILIPTEPPAVSQTVILAEAEGLQNPTLERKTVSIFKRKDLEALWNTVYGSEGAAPPIPVIDFTKNAVIAVLAGKQPAGSYKVTYTGIEDTEDFTNVQFDETVPPIDCRTTDTMTSPFIIVQVPNAGKIFKTIFNTQQAECSGM
jgi:hypothetical protein